MTEQWYFNTIKDTVYLRARVESENEDDVLGDARSEIGPGEDINGVTFEELQQAGTGVLVIDGEETYIEA